MQLYKMTRVEYKNGKVLLKKCWWNKEFKDLCEMFSRAKTMTNLEQICYEGMLYLTQTSRWLVD